MSREHNLYKVTFEHSEVPHYIAAKDYYNLFEIIESEECSKDFCQYPLRFEVRFIKIIEVVAKQIFIQNIHYHELIE